VGGFNIRPQRDLKRRVQFHDLLSEPQRSLEKVFYKTKFAGRGVNIVFNREFEYNKAKRAGCIFE